MSTITPEEIKAQVAAYRQGLEAINKAYARQNAPASPQPQRLGMK